jgi:AbrB family looped-hinge helix DNA binding protein
MNSDNELKFKTITVSYNGQITIPVDIQKIMGLTKGEKLILLQKGKMIIF